MRAYRGAVASYGVVILEQEYGLNASGPSWGVFFCPSALATGALAAMAQYAICEWRILPKAQTQRPKYTQPLGRAISPLEALLRGE